MIVMKFGGTSMQDPSCIERVTEIVRVRLDLSPVLVFSAMGKTTRHLLETAKLASTGLDQKAETQLEEIRQYHLELAEAFLSGASLHDTQGNLDRHFAEIQKLLGGLFILRELTLRSQDKILSYGELMATEIITAVFRARGISADRLDARDFIITDDRFTRARPLEEITYPKIREHVHPVLEKGHVPVVQGFIGSTEDGATTTLGFEGSDFTATLLSAALDASAVQIWKDVPGLMTADPSMINQARTVKTLSFGEAAELTFFGAKVLHPSAIEPAYRKNIPVYIYNSKEPTRTGTQIASTSKHGKNLIKSIAYKRPLCILHVESKGLVAPHDFFKEVFDVMNRERIVPYVTATSETKAVLAINAEDNMNLLVEDLSHFGNVRVVQNKATVSLVGENLRQTHDVASSVFGNLKGRRVDMVAHGASPICFTFVVEESEVEDVIAQLHDVFFQDLDPEIFE